MDESVYRDGIINSYLRLRYQLEKAGAKFQGHPEDIVDVLILDTSELEMMLSQLRNVVIEPLECRWDQL